MRGCARCRHDRERTEPTATSRRAASDQRVNRCVEGPWGPRGVTSRRRRAFAPEDGDLRGTRRHRRPRVRHRQPSAPGAEVGRTPPQSAKSPGAGWSRRCGGAPRPGGVGQPHRTHRAVLGLVVDELPDGERVHVHRTDCVHRAGVPLAVRTAGSGSERLQVPTCVDRSLRQTERGRCRRLRQTGANESQAVAASPDDHSGPDQQAGVWAVGVSACGPEGRNRTPPPAPATRNRERDASARRTRHREASAPSRERAR